MKSKKSEPEKFYILNGVRRAVVEPLGELNQLPVVPLGRVKLI
jgi:hypothetical protein